MNKDDREKKFSDSPTLQIATDLQRAYDFFNDELFSGHLPKCSINLRCFHPVHGYFVCSALVNHEGTHYVHEIRLNPSYFMTRTIKETLSTLVHEMTHLWEAEVSGKTSQRQRIYHSKAWSARMKSVGLYPSATGAEFLEDGKTRPKETGDKMSQYIVEGGPFDQAADRLLDDELFCLHWIDRFPADVPAGLATPHLNCTKDDGVTIIERPLGSGSAERYFRVNSNGNTQLIPERRLLGAATKVNWPSEPGSMQTRHKYECHGCHTRIWGKRGLAAQCTNCGMPFEVTSRSRGYSARKVRSSSPVEKQ